MNMCSDFFSRARLADHTHILGYPHKKNRMLNLLPQLNARPITDDTTETSVLLEKSYYMLHSDISVVKQSGLNHNSFRPHPHVAMCLLVTDFVLTLTQPCAYWPLLSPSPSCSLVVTGHTFRIIENLNSWIVEFNFQVLHICTCQAMSATSRLKCRNFTWCFIISLQFVFQKKELDFLYYQKFFVNTRAIKLCFITYVWIIVKLLFFRETWIWQYWLS
jgi:hypothetical protein